MSMNDMNGTENLHELYKKAMESSKPNKISSIVVAVLGLVKWLLFATCMTRGFVPRDIRYMTLYVFTAVILDVVGYFLTTWSGSRLSAATSLILELSFKIAKDMYPEISYADILLGKHPKTPWAIVTAPIENEKVKCDFEVISAEKRDGYILRTQRYFKGTKQQFDMIAAFTPEGHYIGDEADAKFFIDKGIKPELSAPHHGTCSIGFCEKEQKWYGWSHRALEGFGIGHVVQEGDEGSERMPVGFEVKTLDDAKRVATAFADSVS